MPLRYFQCLIPRYCGSGQFVHRLSWLKLVDVCCCAEQTLDFLSGLSYSGNEHKSRLPVCLPVGVFLWSNKMTDAKILTLVDRLERCLLGKEEFHHRDHLAVATAYLYAADFETAMDRMRASLKRFAVHHNVTKLYHETLTHFWLLQVEQRLDRNQCLGQSVQTIQEQLKDKSLAFNYYSRERIDSKEARESWLEPDLKEL